MLSGYEMNILSRIRNSDAEAFGTLYEKEWRLLYTLALQKTGDKDDAADLVQNVFTDFWDSRKKIPEINSVHAYLRGIMVYKIARYFRTKGFNKKHYENFERFTQGATATNNGFLLKETETSGREILDFVGRKIDALPEKMKRIFVLSCSREYSVAEIAELLDLSPQTVKNQVSSALSRIRKASERFELSHPEIAVISAIVLNF